MTTQNHCTHLRDMQTLFRINTFQGSLLIMRKFITLFFYLFHHLRINSLYFNKNKNYKKQFYDFIRRLKLTEKISS